MRVKNISTEQNRTKHSVTTAERESDLHGTTGTREPFSNEPRGGGGVHRAEGHAHMVQIEPSASFQNKQWKTIQSNRKERKRECGMWIIAENEY